MEALTIKDPMSKVKPYTISVPQSKLDRLNRRLQDTEWPDDIEDAGWQYGPPVADIKRIAHHWQTAFSWREHEKRLNELPNFSTSVDIDGFGDVDMHFIHQESSVKGAIPLLFVHGWPGSFLEVTKLLPLLKAAEAKGGPAFNVVAPSLPNYGFSGATLKKGFAVKQYAEACHKVMLALGYDQYVTQGGDWGFVITRALGHLYPQHVKASHINWAWAAQPEFNAQNPEPEYSEREKKQLAFAANWSPFGMGDGRGYIAIQSTRPQTLNYSLADSPAGLLAWIHDKLVDWTDAYPWTDDEVCLWVSLYVFSRAGPAASSFVYYEALHDASVITIPIVQGYIDVPLGIADFPVELANSPRAWRKSMGPIVWEGVYERGGHFAAWERPGDLVGGLGEMFGRGGGAAGVVEGKNGY